MTEHDLRDRLSREVRRLRNEAGLSVKEAAAKIRMHPRLWQKIEGGETNATVHTLARLGDALDVDPVVLLGEPPDVGAPSPDAARAAHATKPRK